MSGFCEDSGVFELSWSKMLSYVSHRFPDGISSDDAHSVVENLIKSSRYTFLGKNEYGFKLVANHAQIWELLSNKPATFGFTDEDPEITYQKWLVSREWFNATELGKELKVPLSAVKVNKILENQGLILREQGGWVASAQALSRNLVKPRESTARFGYKPTVLFHRDLIAILMDEVSSC